MYSVYIRCIVGVYWGNIGIVLGKWKRTCCTTRRGRSFWKFLMIAQCTRSLAFSLSFYLLHIISVQQKPQCYPYITLYRFVISMFFSIVPIQSQHIYLIVTCFPFFRCPYIAPIHPQRDGVVARGGVRNLRQPWEATLLI